MNLFDLKFVGAVIGGLLVTFLLSTATTLKERATSIVSGIIAALFFTEPLVGWADLDLPGIHYAAAAVLAMSGDRLARRVLGLVDTAQLPGAKK